MNDEIIERIRISIHAPAKGATHMNLPSNPPIEFQSTHPRRVRHKMVRIDKLDIDISIHAPAKGATQMPISKKSYL